MSTVRHVDGLWVGSWRGIPEHLTRVETALLLIKQHSPLDDARVVRELERIWVFFSFQGIGEYNHALKACVLDERHVADPATTVEQIASTIVHETTHARLDRYGIEYREEQRMRIETICFRRELAFSRRLPDSAELRESIAYGLEWIQTNAARFRNDTFEEGHATGGVAALRYLKTPEWSIRAVLMLQPVVNGIRRLFRSFRR